MLHCKLESYPKSNLGNIKLAMSIILANPQENIVWLKKKKKQGPWREMK